MWNCYRKGLFALLLKLFFGLMLMATSAVGEVANPTRQLVDKADVTYSTRFAWSCSPTYGKDAHSF